MKVYEFSDHEAFIAAARASYHRKTLEKAFSFLPEDELAEMLPDTRLSVGKAVIGGALLGAAGAFLMQYWPNVWGYSVNVAGKPLNSWPAFLLICFEMGVLFGAFSGVACFFYTNQYPRFDRTIFALEAYNQNRHQHYFIVTTKEEHHAQAIAVHDLPAAP